jgi:acetyl-CoA carboxylase biotin carboxyl carrier protein
LLTFEQIKELIELVAERRLQGIEVERSGFRLKVDGYTVLAARAAEPAPASAGSAPPAHYAAPPAPSAPASAAGAGTAPAPAGGGAAGTAGGTATAAPAGPPAGSAVVNSPIVGTFYRSPSPEAGPFVDVGSRVKKGQVLCIIEAMKLMNEIECDVDGVVAEIYPKNAQPVEFGEPLFAIRPD